MERDDLMAISRRLDEVVGTCDDPRAALVELVREHGPERTAYVARIVFGSWRTRIDVAEDMIQQVIAENATNDRLDGAALPGPPFDRAG